MHTGDVCPQSHAAPDAQVSWAERRGLVVTCSEQPRPGPRQVGGDGEWAWAGMCSCAVARCKTGRKTGCKAILP